MGFLKFPHAVPPIAVRPRGSSPPAAMAAIIRLIIILPYITIHEKNLLPLGCLGHGDAMTALSRHIFKATMSGGRAQGETTWSQSTQGLSKAFRKYAYETPDHKSHRLPT